MIKKGERLSQENLKSSVLNKLKEVQYMGTDLISVVHEVLTKIWQKIKTNNTNTNDNTN